MESTISKATNHTLQKEALPGGVPATHAKKIRHAYIRFSLLYIFILLSPGAISQELQQEESRKTVGVVLSGGGAKGVAHVGVLKALEENNIAIDYIAGTSIGAMVGGMYAAGYSPDEILEIMDSKDFADAAKGRLDKKHDFYFFHHDPTPVWFTFNYSLEHVLDIQGIIKQNLPANLVSPGMMDFMFMEHLGPASAVAQNNFDSLFIPFRCVASDITNKAAVRMFKGHLPEAVRASMTFPFYFKPIIIDGKVLFDGGMFNNFPADIIVQDFNPDIIIGSVVASNPKPPSVNDIVSQLENMLMVFSNYALPEGAEGIILHPQVPELSVTDFSKNQEVFESGYQETISNLDSILSLNPYRRYKQEVMYNRLMFRKRYPEPTIKNIILSETSPEGEFAKAFLQPEPKDLSFAQLRDNYYRLLSIDKFRHIYPRLNHNGPQNHYELELELTKNYAFHRGFGGNLSSKSVNQFFAMFAFEKLGKYPLTLYSNFFIGNNYNSIKTGARIDFLRKRPFYLLAELSGSRWNYASEAVFIFEEQKPSFIIQQELLSDLRLVFPSGYKGKLETGVFYSRSLNQYYNTGLFSKSDTTDQTRFNPVGYYVSWEKNTLDHWQYPTSGSFFNTSARLIAGNEDYKPGSTSFNPRRTQNYLRWWELGIKWENFFTDYEVVRPAFISEVFLSNRPLLANYSASRVLAKQYNPFAFAKTRYLDAFRANHYAALGLKTAVVLSRNWFVQAEAHAFHAFTEIYQGISHSAKYRKNKFDPTFMYHAALVYHTPIGPLSASLSYFDKEEKPMTFVINFGYILFNRKSF